jgi:hypothetical protein
LARAAHERGEYRKLYELALLKLERVKRRVRAQNNSERVDASRCKWVLSPKIERAVDGVAFATPR